MGFDILP